MEKKRGYTPRGRKSHVWSPTPFPEGGSPTNYQSKCGLYYSIRMIDFVGTPLPTECKSCALPGGVR
ncbi:hypothetical protein LCGC14_1430210 [marine sediment metagenome]|uniref:Uncharacterized protein n=1 Tax=marine sediment metagenome TaxID=412755 RepID=A0A0F9JP43_9ZZZZ